MMPTSMFCIVCCIMGTMTFFHMVPMFAAHDAEHECGHWSFTPANVSKDFGDFFFQTKYTSPWLIPIKMKIFDSDVKKILTADSAHRHELGDVEQHGDDAEGGTQTLCWNIGLVSKMGNFDLKLVCYYNKLNDQFCEIDTTNATYLLQLLAPKHVKLAVLQTDNRSYAAMVACLGGKTIWFVLSTTPAIPDDTEEEIVTKLKDLDLFQSHGGINMDYNTQKIGVEYSLSIDINKDDCVLPDESE